MRHWTLRRRWAQEGAATFDCQDVVMGTQQCAPLYVVSLQKGVLRFPGEGDGILRKQQPALPSYSCYVGDIHMAYLKLQQVLQGALGCTAGHRLPARRISIQHDGASQSCPSVYSGQASSLRHTATDFPSHSWPVTLQMT